MGIVPNKCPMCGESIDWKLVDVTKKVFRVGNAAVGAVLLGSVKEKGILLLRKNVDSNMSIKFIFYTGHR